MQVNDGSPVDPQDAGDNGADAEAGCRGRGGVVLGSTSRGRRCAVLDRPVVETCGVAGALSRDGGCGACRGAGQRRGRGSLGGVRYRR
jgi:hypothetical protein